MAELLDKDAALYDAPVDDTAHREGRTILYSVEGDVIVQRHSEDGIVEGMTGKGVMSEYSFEEMKDMNRSVLVPSDGEVFAVVDE